MVTTATVCRREVLQQRYVEERSFGNLYWYLYRYQHVLGSVWQTIMKIILLKLPLSVSSAL